VRRGAEAQEWLLRGPVLGERPTTARHVPHVPILRDKNAQGRIRRPLQCSELRGREGRRFGSDRGVLACKHAGVSCYFVPPPGQLAGVELVETGCELSVPLPNEPGSAFRAVHVDAKYFPWGPLRTLFNLFRDCEIFYDPITYWRTPLRSPPILLLALSHMFHGSLEPPQTPL
jgi:hypothetical protein